MAAKKRGKSIKTGGGGDGERESGGGGGELKTPIGTNELLEQFSQKLQ